MAAMAMLATLALLGGTMGQDITPCEKYDLATGVGSCGDIAVNISAVICANGFDANVCKASLASTTRGYTETYYFKVSFFNTLSEHNTIHDPARKGKTFSLLLCGDPRTSADPRMPLITADVRVRAHRQDSQLDL
jgi:hypothetical protein